MKPTRKAAIRYASRKRRGEWRQGGLSIAADLARINFSSVYYEAPSMLDEELDSSSTN